MKSATKRNGEWVTRGGKFKLLDPENQHRVPLRGHRDSHGVLQWLR